MARADRILLRCPECGDRFFLHAQDGFIPVEGAAEETTWAVRYRAEHICMEDAHSAALTLRRAYHSAGPKCLPVGCPGVDECCYAEDDGTGPESAARWQEAASLLARGIAG